MKGRRKQLTALVIAGLTSAVPAPPVSASNWAVGIAAGSVAESKSAALPGGPTGVTAVCVSSTGSKVTVSWNAVPLASTYTLLQSTTSATTGYSVVSSGLTAVTLTLGKLSSGNYWFEVSATIGTNWNGPASFATAETTVIKNKSCAQP